MIEQVEGPDGVVHVFGQMFHRTRCGRHMKFGEEWTPTRDETDCMACIASNEPGYFETRRPTWTS